MFSGLAKKKKKNNVKAIKKIPTTSNHDEKSISKNGVLPVKTPFLPKNTSFFLKVKK